MNKKTISLLKRSIVKIQGVNTTYNFVEPYLQAEEYESGGTAFFVDDTLFGSRFPRKAHCRYLLTNFHVVQNYNTKYAILEWPERCKSYMTAEVLFVSPNLDVAILELDLRLPQPKWWLGDSSQWLETIKNCPINMNIIKGCSQSVKCIGYPNLQGDNQISDGTLSSRNMGMLSCDLTLNSGNSGGPLFHKNMVIGICTASVSDSERLALAVPIQEIFRFFNYWTTYSDRILRLPCWGLEVKKLTKDYMEYKNINSKYQGALIKHVIDGQSACKAGLKEGDILLAIETKDQRGETVRYDIDSFGQVKFASTDKRQQLTTIEFMLNLDPDFLLIHYYRRRRTYTTSIKLKPIDFKVRMRYPSYENTMEYDLFGGMVFSDLHLNHLQGDVDDDEEEEEILFDHSILNTLKKSSGMDHIVIITHINPQSYVCFSTDIQENEQVIKINGKKIKSCNHLSTVLDSIAKDYYQGKIKFIEMETTNNVHVLNLEALSDQEREDNATHHYKKVLRLLNQRGRKKRKRRT